MCSRFKGSLPVHESSEYLKSELKKENTKEYIFRTTMIVQISKEEDLSDGLFELFYHVFRIPYCGMIYPRRIKSLPIKIYS